MQKASQDARSRWFPAFSVIIIRIMTAKQGNVRGEEREKKNKTWTTAENEVKKDNYCRADCFLFSDFYFLFTL